MICQSLPPRSLRRGECGPDPRVAGLALRFAGFIDSQCTASPGAPRAAEFFCDGRGWSTLTEPRRPSRCRRAAGRAGAAPAADRQPRSTCCCSPGCPRSTRARDHAARAAPPRRAARRASGWPRWWSRSLPDRALLRRLLHDGAAVRSGLLASPATAPSSSGRWSSPTSCGTRCTGHDAWPRSLHRVEVAAAAGRARRLARLPAVRRARSPCDAGTGHLLLVAVRRRRRGPEPLRRPGRGRRAGRRRRPGCAGRHRPASALLAAARRRPRRRAGGRRARPGRRRRPRPDLGRVSRPGAGVRAPGVGPPAGRPGGAGRPARPDRRRRPPRRLAGRAAGARRRRRRRWPPGTRSTRPVTAQVALDLRGRERLAGGRAGPARRSPPPSAPAPGSPCRRGRPAHAPGRLGAAGPGAGAVRAAPRRRSPGSTTSRSCSTTGACATAPGPTAACGCCSPARPAPASRWPPRSSPPRPATDLLVVDVSRVVSKWLGETEKNLAAVFDAAERTQAVLLLDEADALFGTRTEISDAHDRYANLETAYLLQRLERFDGLAVLTTNLRQNIDPAFIRRMDFVRRVPAARRGRAARELWRRHLPAGAAAPTTSTSTRSPGSTRSPAAGSATPPSPRPSSPRPADGRVRPGAPRRGHAPRVRQGQQTLPG